MSQEHIDQLSSHEEKLLQHDTDKIKELNEQIEVARKDSNAEQEKNFKAELKQISTELKEDIVNSVNSVNQITMFYSKNKMPIPDDVKEIMQNLRQQAIKLGALVGIKFTPQSKKEKEQDNKTVEEQTEEPLPEWLDKIISDENTRKVLLKSLEKTGLQTIRVNDSKRFAIDQFLESLKIAYANEQIPKPLLEKMVTKKGFIEEAAARYAALVNNSKNFEKILDNDEDAYGEKLKKLAGSSF